MTQREFVEKYRHELFGMVCDAYIHRRDGAELSLSLRASAAKLDGMLKAMHSDLTGAQAESKPPAGASPTKRT